LAIIQSTTEVFHADLIELDAPTEAELCTRGAVKLTYKRVAELKTALHEVQTELRGERERNASLTAQLNAIQTDYRVLEASLQSTRYREVIMRVIEIVIVALLTYAVDFLKLGEMKNFAVFIFISLVLVLIIALIQWTPRPKASK
jgi:hypothetical protein